MSWTYHPELLATPVPRYTSYPTAAEFTTEVGRADMDSALAAVGADQPVSLYLHIPYCHEICWYCGCNTGAANRTHRLATYLEALAAEVALMAARLGGRGQIGRIAFGGGSPNAIAPSQFAALLQQVREAFDAHDADISIELDPRSLDDGWFDAIAKAGITRASLGVQTLDPDIQAGIGRVQPLALIEQATVGLRRAGVTSLNFDLMYGLPGQDAAILEATLRDAVRLRPDRTALFGYAHVPHLIPRQRRIDDSALPGAAERFHQAELGHALLTEAGYEPVGFDHYALPSDPLALAARGGTLRRNFQGFTDDPAEVLIGMGASAISQLPGLLAQNEKNAGRYRMQVGAHLLPVERGVRRSATDQRRGRLIESLLCRGNASAAGLLDASVGERLHPFVDADLIRLDGDELFLRPDAQPYARVIAAIFDQYRQPQARRFSSAI
ncbi:oxygen-independent coproporphyrinogen III oxidase [Sphingomonas sp. KRR8]|uniref:oxygen-independent coproporphyrinogen III oxidase n=1 Tax=Sphingomonas sp. KRR8 TaxID=2942996 RepID=UPI002021D23F|nr:oxygen-independent coproporphyrinogen III oxidase [Sphingomonas sp. KRR8]URD60563.1 oxygen-independent coproporphyrinogen III oxidase [Sphingomonas sp. KRR8]